MDEKLKNKLINALKKAGMSEALAESMNGLSEEQVDKFIAGLPNQQPTPPTPQEVVKSKAFTEYLENGGFDELLKTSKSAQSQFDKKVTKALGTFKQNLLGEKQAQNNAQQDQGGVDLPTTGNETVDQMMKLMKQQQEQINALINARTTEANQNTVASALASSKLPKSQHAYLAKLIEVGGEVSVEDQISELEKTFGAENQADEQSKPNGTGYNFQQGRQNQGGRTEGDKSKLASFAAKL